MKKNEIEIYLYNMKPRLKNGKKIRLNLLISANLHNRFKDYCKNNGLKMTWVIQSLIEEFLKKGNI